MNLKIDEAVWYIEEYSNAYPEIMLGKLIDIQKDKAIMLIGRQNYGVAEIYYEDIEWSNPLRNTFAFNEYDKAKEKLELCIKDYEIKLKRKTESAIQN